MYNKKVLSTALKNLNKTNSPVNKKDLLYPMNNDYQFNGNMSMMKEGGSKNFVNSKEHGIDTPVYIKTEEKSSPIHGTGVFTKQPVAEGQVIGVSHIRKQYERNGEMYQAPFPSKTIGGYNHSETPNITEIDRGDHIVMVALRNIEPGEELVSNYYETNIDDLEKPEDFKNELTKAKYGKELVKNTSQILKTSPNANIFDIRKMNLNPFQLDQLIKDANKQLQIFGKSEFESLSSPEGLRRLRLNYKNLNPNLTNSQIDALVANNLNELKISFENNTAAYLEKFRPHIFTDSHGNEQIDWDLVDHFMPSNNAHQANLPYIFRSMELGEDLGKGVNYFRDPMLDRSFNYHDYMDQFKLDSEKYIDPVLLNDRSSRLARRRKIVPVNKINEELFRGADMSLTPGWNPGYMGFGLNEINPATFAHETGHGIQRGGLSNTDLELHKAYFTNNSYLNNFLLKLYNNSKKNDSNFKRDLNYFTSGSFFSEPLPFARQMRQSMVDEGMLSDRYDFITPPLIRDFQHLNTTSELGDRLSKLTPSFKRKTLANILNNAPVVGGVMLGAGAYGLTNPLSFSPEMWKFKKNGGAVKQLPKASKGVGKVIQAAAKTSKPLYKQLTLPLDFTSNISKLNNRMSPEQIEMIQSKFNVVPQIEAPIYSVTEFLDDVNFQLNQGLGIKKLPNLNLKLELDRPVGFYPKERFIDNDHYAFNLLSDFHTPGKFEKMGEIDLGKYKDDREGKTFEKIYDYPFKHFSAPTFRELRGQGISAETNKAITNSLQRFGLNPLISSDHHTNPGLDRWKRLVELGLAEHFPNAKNEYRFQLLNWALPIIGTGAGAYGLSNPWQQEQPNYLLNRKYGGSTGQPLTKVKPTPDKYIQAELSQDEIDEYVKGGYIVEDLPKASGGLELLKSISNASKSVGNTIKGMTNITPKLAELSRVNYLNSVYPGTLELISNLKNANIISPTLNENVLAMYPNLLNLAAKRGIQDALTFTRSTTPSVLEGLSSSGTRTPISNLDLNAYKKFGLLEDEPGMAMYSASYVPGMRYGRRDGLSLLPYETTFVGGTQQGTPTSLDALYTFPQISGVPQGVQKGMFGDTYGDYATILRYPFDYSGSASDMLGRFNTLQNDLFSKGRLLKKNYGAEGAKAGDVGVLNLTQPSTLDNVFYQSIFSTAPEVPFIGNPGQKVLEPVATYTKPIVQEIKADRENINKLYSEGKYEEVINALNEKVKSGDFGSIESNIKSYEINPEFPKFDMSKYNLPAKGNPTPMTLSIFDPKTGLIPVKGDLESIANNARQAYNSFIEFGVLMDAFRDPSNVVKYPFSPLKYKFKKGGMLPKAKYGIENAAKKLAPTIFNNIPPSNPLLAKVVNRSVIPVGYDPFTVLAAPLEVITPQALKYKPKHFATKNRLDAWRVYNGLEPEFNTFTKNVDGTLAINDFRLDKEGLKKIIDHPKKSFGTMEIEKEFNFGAVHGNGWITKGVDDEGRKFIDFTDTWDLQPLKKIKVLPKKVRDFEVSSISGGKPYDLRNRIYYDNANNFFDHNGNKLIEEVHHFPKGVVKQYEAVDDVMLSTPNVVGTTQMDVLNDWENLTNQKFYKGALVGSGLTLLGINELVKSEREKEEEERNEGSIELDLTPEEIEEYKKGGYIVEDLPKAQLGKEVGKFLQTIGKQKLPWTSAVTPTINKLNNQLGVINNNSKFINDGLLDSHLINPSSTVLSPMRTAESVSHKMAAKKRDLDLSAFSPGNYKEHADNFISAALYPFIGPAVYKSEELYNMIMPPKYRTQARNTIIGHMKERLGNQYYDQMLDPNEPLSLWDNNTTYYLGKKYGVDWNQAMDGWIERHNQSVIDRNQDRRRFLKQDLLKEWARENNLKTFYDNRKLQAYDSEDYIVFPPTEKSLEWDKIVDEKYPLIDQYPTITKSGLKDLIDKGGLDEKAVGGEVISLGDEVDEATKDRLEKLGYTFEEI